MCLQVKFGCQRWIHDRGTSTCIHQKFVGAGTVNDYRHNYSGTLGEAKVYAGSISRAVWLSLKSGKDCGSKTHGSHALDYRHWRSLSRIWLRTVLPLFPATSMS